MGSFMVIYASVVLAGVAGLRTDIHSFVRNPSGIGGMGCLRLRSWTAPPADTIGRPVGMVLISAAENFRCPFIVPTSAISADRIKVIFPVRPENPASPDPCERRRPGHRPLTEDGHPGRLGRRASSLPESHPHRQPPPIQIPSPTPTRRKGGGAFPSCPQPQRMPPPEPDDQGKVNGRVICVLRVICDDVRQRADSLSASQTPDLRPNSLPKC
jgi:hypothetical protein